MKKLLILGSGTAGTMIANEMRHKLRASEWEINIIDKSLEHIYQPGLLFLPFGLYGYKDESAVKKSKKKFLPKGVNFIQADIKLIDHKNKKVNTSSGDYNYDILVVALGCDIHTEDVEGLSAAMGKKAFTFYNLDGAMQLQKALADFKKGRLVFNIAEVPFKCPVAPIEFMFLADYYFTKKGIRKDVELVLTTPMPGAFSKPIASGVLSQAMEEKNIKVVPGFDISEVNTEKMEIASYEKGHEPFDILVIVPPNRGADIIDDSGLGNGAGYIDVDPHTLKAKNADHIFGVGDITDVHTSKAGSVAHFMAEVVVENIMRDIKGEPLAPDFDGHSNCFIESGYHKGYLVDFNYDVEPLPGKFPMPLIGPFKLLKDSWFNHMGKMAFRYLYWNRLLKGKKLAPFGLVTNKLTMRGKDTSLLNK